MSIRAGMKWGFWVLLLTIDRGDADLLGWAVGHNALTGVDLQQTGGYLNYHY